MDGETVRVIIGLCLGANICPCGAQLLEGQFTRGPSCHLVPGCVPRHYVLNDLVRAWMWSIKELSGLCRSNGKRPDSMALIPRRAGRSLVLDAIVADVLHPHIFLPLPRSKSCHKSCCCQKNVQIAKTFIRIFLPAAFEALGPINQDALCFLS